MCRVPTFIYIYCAPEAVASISICFKKYETKSSVVNKRKENHNAQLNTKVSTFYRTGVEISVIISLTIQTDWVSGNKMTSRKNLFTCAYF